jgi:hypothetical protein
MFFMKIEIKDIIYINKIGKWILLLLPLFLFSCTEDSNGTGSVDSDGTAIIRLTVRPNDATQVTRTSSSTESKVSNLYILVFNSSGKVVGTKYSSTTDTTVSITTRQGTNYTIYAVANTGNSVFFQGVGTLTQFKKMLTTMDVNTYPLMCGCLTGQSVSQSSVTIGGLKLTRMFAKVTLNVTAAAGITITGYQFCNVATSAYLDRDTVAGITWANKTAVTASSISGVTYYMYGNPQGTVTHTNQIYKTQSAPSNASYVLVTATQSNVTATYKIYLGSDNISDYNVYRNYSYTYNITLTSLYTADTRVTIGSSATTQTSSNCYIVNPGGNSIGILVSRANADGTTRLSSTTAGWTCGLLWTDNSNGLSSSGAVASIVADATNGRIIVTSGTGIGNAIVYVKDSSGNIAWSWHIWVTSYNPNTTYQNYNGYVVMDRNLGATTNSTGVQTSFGLMYQWGRKDPFPAMTFSNAPSPMYGNITSITNTPVSTINNLNNSIQNPATFYTSAVDLFDWYTNSNASSNQNGNLWSTTKTVYDPCPMGWKVPPISLWSGFTLDNFTIISNGRIHSTYGCFYPVCGYIHQDGSYDEVGQCTDYWSCNGAQRMDFHISDAFLAIGATESRHVWGMSIRCVKE